MSINETDKQFNALSCALSYAERGYRVFPCHSVVIDGICTCGHLDCERKGKHPLTRHGCNDASADADVIRAWWEQWPLANVALATGGNYFVLDVDPDKGGGQSLTDLEAKHGALPPTLAVKTGSGGRHLYFRLSEGVRVRSRSGVAPGLDTRGEGGYVLAPPSAHVSGGSYEWQTPPDTPLADAPAWLLALAKAEAKADAPGECGSRAPGNGRRPARGSATAQRPQGGGMILTMGADVGDLRTHPGAAEGTRNATLCRLVGIHLARGESAGAVEALALAWAARCSPPYPEPDVRRTVSALARKHDKQEGHGEDNGARIGEEGRKELSPADVSEGEGEILPSFLPDAHADAWPTLDADALQGLAGRIVNAIAPETEADPVGILLSLLAAFGNAVGKRPRFRVNADEHPPTLFVCLGGDTAAGKGQAWNVAKALLKRADPHWARQCIAHGLSSGEGLVERVKDPEPSEGEGLALAMPPEQRLLCYESEFARPITAMRREGNTLSPLLRAAWDGETLEVLTRGKSRLRASNAHVSIVAHVTPEELRKLLSQSVEVANGFANRFLWCMVRRSRLLPFGGDMGVLDAFAKPLADALANARGVGEMTLTPDAKSHWESIYPALATARPGAFGKATERARPQVMRLALVYALLDGGNVIGEGHLRAALAVWRYCEASARLLFGEGVGADKEEGRAETPLAVRVADSIARRPGIKTSELLRAFRVTADALREALAWLRVEGLAHPRQCKGDGRPAECWYPGREPTPPDEGDGEGKEGSNSADAPPAAEADALTSFLPTLVMQADTSAAGDAQAGDTSFLPPHADAKPDADAQAGVPEPAPPIFVPLMPPADADALAPANAVSDAYGVAGAVADDADAQTVAAFIAELDAMPPDDGKPLIERVSLADAFRAGHSSGH